MSKVHVNSKSAKIIMDISSASLSALRSDIEMSRDALLVNAASVCELDYETVDRYIDASLNYLVFSGEVYPSAMNNHWHIKE